MGVVDKRYVVAFTGISKRKWFSEDDKSVAASFSVWRAEIPQVATVAKDPSRLWRFPGRDEDRGKQYRAAFHYVSESIEYAVPLLNHRFQVNG